MAKLKKIEPEGLITKHESWALARDVVDLLWEDITKTFALSYGDRGFRREEAIRAARIMICGLKKSQYIRDRNNHYWGGCADWRGGIAFSIYLRRIFLWERRHGKKWEYGVRPVCPPCTYIEYVVEGGV